MVMKLSKGYGRIVEKFFRSRNELTISTLLVVLAKYVFRKLLYDTLYYVEGETF